MQLLKIWAITFSPWAKGHYGVALLTKQEPKAVRRGFPTDNEDAQKRIIMADLETPFGLLTVINGYFHRAKVVHMKPSFRQKKNLMRIFNAI